MVFIARGEHLRAIQGSGLKVDRQHGDFLASTATATAAPATAGVVACPPTIVDRTTTFVDNLPAGGTSSMQRDIIDGKPSELDDLNGAVIRLGAAAGVPTPTNDVIYAGLVMLERRARGEIAF